MNRNGFVIEREVAVGGGVQPDPVLLRGDGNKGPGRARLNPGLFEISPLSSQALPEQAPLHLR